MKQTGLFFRVASTISNAPLRDCLWHGYESRDDFKRGLRNLVGLWHDRVGECIEERNGFLRLRFHDTPGGVPDEEWLPSYLLHQVDPPPYITESRNSEEEELERELDEAFGFD